MINTILFILLLIDPAFGQTASLEIVSDTSSKTPFLLFVNGIQQNTEPKQHVKITNFPLEVYRFQVKLTNGTELQSMAFLNLGKIRSFLISKVNNTYFLTEGGLSTYNHPAIKDSVALKEVESEVLATLAFEPATSAFDDAPKENTPNNAPHNLAEALQKKEARIETPVISPAQQQALERLKAKPILGDDVGPDCFLTIQQEDIENIKTRMREENSSKERVNFSVSMLSNKCLTIHALKSLMRLIDGDDLKLEYFKRLRAQLIDIENKTELTSLFLMESSIQQFNEIP